MAEQSAFVFAITFIIIFSALLITVPTDFQGSGYTAETVTPVNPNLVTDFAESKTFDKTDFGGVLSLYYIYDLPTGGTTWESILSGGAFYVAAHALFLGVWLGGLDYVDFIDDENVNQGTSITFADLDAYMTDGVARYTLQFADSGNSAGGYIFYYNTTTYTDSQDAWDNDELYLTHGVGFTADTNVVTLLVSLLFLQLPEVPTLINVLLITAPWSSIIYIIWFIIKESLPFL